MRVNSPSQRRHRRMLKLAEGFRGRRSTCYKLAKRSVQKALKYAYRDRKAKKREFRALWITRINAASRMAGISYSQLILGLKNAKIEIDRKVLADFAMNKPELFTACVDKAKAALPTKAAA